MPHASLLVACLLLAGLVQSAETLTFTMTNSKPAGSAQNGNANAMAMWATDSGNTTLKKTFARWVGKNTNPASANGYLGLTWWRHFTGGNGEVDGFMGATRGSYGNVVSLNNTGAPTAGTKPSWDMSLKAGGTAPDATYTIWMETATNNNPPTNSGNTTTSCARYHFSFAKDGVSRTVTITDTYYGGSWTYTGRVPSITNPALAISVGGATTFTVTNNAAVAPAGYQWRKGGTPIGGATSSTYAIPSAGTGDAGSYDCVVTYPNTYGLATAPSMVSNALSLTVTSGSVAATGSAITPATSTVNPGSTVTLTNTVTPADATSPVYAWYSNASNSTSGGALIGGQSLATYQPSTASAGTVWYYGTVTAGGSTVTSTSAVQVTVRAAPTISVQPASTTVVAGSAATVSISAGDGGFPALTYQWQSMPFGGSWSTLTGATSASFSITSPVNATQYRCVLTNAGGAGVSTTSTAATLTVVQPPTITTDTIPLNPSALAGDPVNLSVAATIPGTPAGTLSYRWQYRSSPAGTFANVGGATSADFATTAATNGEQYRCILTNTVNAVGASTTSRITTVTVAAPSAPAFTTQPISVSIGLGMTATFTVLANGVPTPTLQWSDSPDNVTFTPIGGATSTAYTTPMTNAGDVGVPRHYRCTATNASGSATSVVATRSVTGAPTGIAYVNFTSSSAGGTYAPKHVMVAWIQRNTTFITTIGDWSSERKVSLVLWNSVSSGADAVMGATQLSHQQVGNLIWHFNPATTPDGTYSLWLESADDNTGPIGPASETSVTGANRTRLDFSIVSGAVVETVGSGGGFTGIRISALVDPTASSGLGSGATPQTDGKVVNCGSGGIFALIIGSLALLLVRRRQR
jgi:hypothetical protein